ncbi:VOC family protein [Streptomyces sp. LHD-70]|uniref:VOC family protein n=1 Tax=Streptomyces sp. LHD-70 TaxID=3072140 RepID=UPI00280E9E47|nr:VOC family protein [Streptomyces sp. LHD-70]MDQ8704097.1 VOC family protein [Streptomyces sp. LHD-70]
MACLRRIPVRHGPVLHHRRRSDRRLPAPAGAAVTAPRTAATGGTGIDLDHTSFAVHDAMRWARFLRRKLGATPISGETLPEFRYLLLYVGAPEQGARLELMEPQGDGFLTRNLAKRGEGPHHVTFTVPDLRAAVARVRALGSTVVGESYEHPPWHEAFIVPDDKHAVVIQLAQSDRRYPGPEDLLTTCARDPESLPSVSGATEPLWWTSLWGTPVETTARLGATHLASTDLAFSRRLFEGVLGGELRAEDEHFDFSWPGGSVRVHAAERPGILGMALHGSGFTSVRIGSASLRA